WVEIERKLSALPSFNTQARNLQRLYLGHATEVEMDGQGRILLPQHLREFAFLDKRVAFVGQGGKFEIWDEQRWRDKTLADLEDGHISELVLSSCSIGKLKL
ncbi:MAG TPA: division/cell wall cluster transcriptional repressor MraZ, partial [Lamprocystis sp. (in: g-proteobacteria)]|nr:division/cell wall cluster transcriptional repressor MraZ [Lamprocystis sp. (in: g-proteobacteria)]